jgi:hypothetical protein
MAQPGCTKPQEMPKEQFKQEVEKELTGQETEPWEIVYFKLYKSQMPVVEQVSHKPTCGPAVLFVVQLPLCPSTVAFTISPLFIPWLAKRWVSPKHLHLVT